MICDLLFRHKPVLEIISALLDKCSEPVTFLLSVVLHSIAQAHLIAKQFAAYIQRAVKPRLVYRQCPMHPRILGLCIHIRRAFGIDNIAAGKSKA